VSPPPELNRKMSMLLQKGMLSFKPDSAYDNYFSKTFYTSKVDQIKKTAKKIGIELQREIIIENSTCISPSPSARPSEGAHILFAGPGTMAFCNYWAKGISSLAMGISYTLKGKRAESKESVNDCFKANPAPVILCSKLALYYGFFGTLIEYGQVNIRPSFVALRNELLDAMETFIVGHEYSHFVAEENIDQFRGMISSEQALKLEKFCDELGFKISREYGSEKDSYLLFTGVGALTFFTMFNLCEKIRELVLSVSLNDNEKHGEVFDGKADSHPPLIERIEELRRLLNAYTVPDQLNATVSFFDEYALILNTLCEFILEVAEEAIIKRGLRGN